MAKKGFLSPKTFFPKKGDVLENTEEGENWTCVRVHTFVDELTGQRIKYALLVGRHPDMGDTAIPMTWNSPGTRISKELDEYDCVHRLRGDELIPYKKNEKGVFEEVRA